MIRKMLPLIYAMISTIVITGCSFTFAPDEVRTIIHDTRPAGHPHDLPEMSDIVMPLERPDEVPYFTTVEEAMANNVLYDEAIKYVGKPITWFKHDIHAVLFAIYDAHGGSDTIFVYRFFTKDYPETLISRPISSMGIVWEGHKDSVRMMRLDEIGEIRLSLSLYNRGHLFAVDNTKNFIWGLSQTERVRNLIIEGQQVTEVIEIELDGEIAFFWYFEDLITDKPLIFNDIRTYVDGEMAVAMG